MALGQFQYKNAVFSVSHYKDKTVSVPSYLYNENDTSEKTVVSVLKRGPGGANVEGGDTENRDLSW